MNIKDFKKIDLPDTPGVYFFREGKTRTSKILYIGKATSLRDRVRSYFSNDLIRTRGPAIIDMVTKSQTVTFQETDSVLEALMLEANLIKKNKPKYNTKEKDDRSYYRVIITDEEFPRVLVVRERELKVQKGKYKIKEEFGPYPNAGQLNEALKIIRKIFPFFDTKKVVSEMNERDQRMLNMKTSIGLYPDIFTDNPAKRVSKKEYKQNIKNIKSFFEGNKKKILRDLEKQMKDYAKEQEFEKAEKTKGKIFAVNHINDVMLIKEDSRNIGKEFRIEAYDVAHIMGEASVGVMTVFENGSSAKNEYKKFILRETEKGDDYGGLREIMRRRLNHKEWTFPDLIVTDGGKGQKNVASKIIKELGLNINIVSVVKDDKHKAREILGNKKIIEKHKVSILQVNDEAHRFAINFHRNKLRKRLK